MLLGNACTSFTHLHHDRCKQRAWSETLGTFCSTGLDPWLFSGCFCLSHLQTEVLTDRERDLTQQVAELQGRVAILMDELQTVKLKNVGLERKLNAIYNKEEEERIRKEEAAKEDGWSCISTLFCDLWTWQRFWLVCWKKLEFCCSVSKRDVVRLGQFLKSFASCI